MKIILSRKGFDSTNGGLPSPIMPDGTLLSMPIPSDDSTTYDDLSCKGISYTDLLKQLAPGKSFHQCHLDPDIRESSRTTAVNGWKAAFGQIGSAQGVLNHSGIDKGDLFLFFGWFRRVELHNGCYRFVSPREGSFYDHSDLHVIYGYMQIGDILTNAEDIAKYPWHPHSSSSRLGNRTNALYVPSENLSFLPEYNGFGTLDYREDRVLTMLNQSRSTWIDYPFLLPEHVYGCRKNSARSMGLYYSGIWQELVVYESEGLIEWAKAIIQS